MRSISVNSNSRFEHYESMMVGSSSSLHGHESSFDREAPLDGRPFIEDDHRTPAAAAAASEE